MKFMFATADEVKARYVYQNIGAEIGSSLEGVPEKQKLQSFLFKKYKSEMRNLFSDPAKTAEKNRFIDRLGKENEALANAAKDIEASDLDFSVDGSFGNTSYLALAYFQFKHSAVDVDGAYGSETMRMLSAYQAVGERTQRDLGRTKKAITGESPAPGAYGSREQPIRKNGPKLQTTRETKGFYGTQEISSWPQAKVEAALSMLLRENNANVIMSPMYNFDGATVTIHSGQLPAARTELKYQLSGDRPTPGEGKNDEPLPAAPEAVESGRVYSATGTGGNAENRDVLNDISNTSEFLKVEGESLAIMSMLFEKEYGVGGTVMEGRGIVPLLSRVVGNKTETFNNHRDKEDLIPEENWDLYRGYLNRDVMGNTDILSGMSTAERAQLIADRWEKIDDSQRGFIEKLLSNDPITAEDVMAVSGNKPEVQNWLNETGGVLDDAAVMTVASNVINYLVTGGTGPLIQYAFIPLLKTSAINGTYNVDIATTVSRMNIAKHAEMVREDTSTDPRNLALFQALDKVIRGTATPQTLSGSERSAYDAFQNRLQIDNVYDSSVRAQDDLQATADESAAGKLEIIDVDQGGLRGEINKLMNHYDRYKKETVLRPESEIEGLQSFMKQHGSEFWVAGHIFGLVRDIGQRLETENLDEKVESSIETLNDLIVQIDEKLEDPELSDKKRNQLIADREALIAKGGEFYNYTIDFIPFQGSTTFATTLSILDDLEPDGRMKSSFAKEEKRQQVRDYIETLALFYEQSEYLRGQFFDSEDLMQCMEEERAFVEKMAKSFADNRFRTNGEGGRTTYGEAAQNRANKLKQYMRENFQGEGRIKPSTEPPYDWIKVTNIDQDFSFTYEDGATSTGATRREQVGTNITQAQQLPRGLIRPHANVEQYKNNEAYRLISSAPNSSWGAFYDHFEGKIPLEIHNSNLTTSPISIVNVWEDNGLFRGLNNEARVVAQRRFMEKLMNMPPINQKQLNSLAAAAPKEAQRIKNITPSNETITSTLTGHVNRYLAEVRKENPEFRISPTSFSESQVRAMASSAGVYKLFNNQGLRQQFDRYTVDNTGRKGAVGENKALNSLIANSHSLPVFNMRITVASNDGTVGPVQFDQPLMIRDICFNQQDLDGVSFAGKIGYQYVQEVRQGTKVITVRGKRSVEGRHAERDATMSITKTNGVWLAVPTRWGSDSANAVDKDGGPLVDPGKGGGGTPDPI